jgi:hypothetical protein
MPEPIHLCDNCNCIKYCFDIRRYQHEVTVDSCPNYARQLKGIGMTETKSHPSAKPCVAPPHPAPLPTCAGIKDDVGKPRYELLAPEALEGVARILTFGAQKYSARNWEQGMKWSRVFGALMRHLWAWWRGEGKDKETGESHLHHAACCVMFLQAYEARGGGEDDRAPATSSGSKPL